MKKKTEKINKLKTRRKIGQVVSRKSDKTAIVKVEILGEHRFYAKKYKIHRCFAAHDEKNETKVKDMVEIQPCRPISKTKHWKITEIIK